MVNILDIVNVIHEANTNELRVLEITKDECPQVCYKNVKLGNVTLNYLQINCSEEFENAEFNESLNESFKWNPELGSKVIIKPDEVTKVFAETAKGKTVYYKFHEAKESPIPLEVEMTDNFLFEFVVLEKDAVDFEDYLFTERKKQIIIRYQRKGRNAYRSWGTYKILGTDYTGYILERPKGDNPTQLEDYRRHPAGTYNIGYSEDAGGYREDFYYVTLYIVEHPAYKLHGGNRSDDSDGCLLINYLSPQNDSYPRAHTYVDPNLPMSKRVKRTDKVSVANTYYQHDDPENPARKLRDKVYEMEQDIKNRYKLETVKKMIIIDESNEIIEP